MIRVLIADEKDEVRAAIRSLLADQAGFSAAGEAADGPTALALARSLRPDLIVLENALPGLQGIDIARIAAGELPDTAVVFLAADPAVRDAALSAGATAFVPKDAPSDELLRAIHASAAALKVRRTLREVAPQWRRVFELLLGSRLLTEEQLQTIVARQNPHESPATTILRAGFVTQQDLADALARASGTAGASLGPYPEIDAPIDPTEPRLSSRRLVDPVERGAARLLPLDFARSRGVVVTASDGHDGVVAMVDPLDEIAFHEVQRFTGLKLVRVTATLDDVQDAVARAWSSNGTGPVIWTGSLLSRVYASAVLLVVGLSAVAGFGLLVREALTPRFAFSLFALFCGLFFFLYALKYYVTIASVVLITLFGDPVRFSRNGKSATQGGNDARSKLKADGRTTDDGLASGQHKEGYRTLRGDLLSQAGSVVVTDPWQRIGEIRLPADRQPFVSVQLALYNESEVVDRLLTACTSFDYENYEVLVVDDSTDDTVQKLERWAKHPRVRVLHRANRKGFKGGALQEALKRMNARTEYVMIFDADFVPPADAIWHFLDYFGRLAKAKYANGEHATTAGAPQNGDRVAAVQGYQWHMLNASENWITKGVRAEFSGSYVLERSGQELFGAMKMISGSVYMIRADVLRKLGWSTSITEDWELTIRLYLAGYKVLYTPYIQAPAECVSTVRRLIKQRMRWAEGHTYNVRKYFWAILRSPNLSWQEKLEFIYYAPYYLQSVLFAVATGSWIVGVLILGQKLPMWGEVFGWSLVVSNALALPLMNLAGVLLEGSLRRDALGLLSFIGLSWVLAPFQAYASMKAMSERKEGGWVRTPKSGVVTERLERFHLARLMPWEMPKRRRGPKKASRFAHLAAGVVAVFVAAGILTVGALSIRASAQSGARGGIDFAIPAILGTGVPLMIVPLGYLRSRRRFTALALAFTLGLGTNVVYLAHAVPAVAVTDNTSVFTFRNSTTYVGAPTSNMEQHYTPAVGSQPTKCPSSKSFNWTCSFVTDTFSSGQTMNAGTAQVDLYLENDPPVLFHSISTNSGATAACPMTAPSPISDGDVMLAACAFRGGTGTTVTTVPAGWNLLARIDNGTTLSLVVYSHVVTSAASEPASYTWDLSTSVKRSWSIIAYSGVDNANPIDVSLGQATPSSTQHAAPSVTPNSANGMLVTFLSAAYCANWTPPPAMTQRGSTNWCSQSLSSNETLETNELALGAAGVATGTQTGTLSQGTAVGATMSVALRKSTAAPTCTFTVQLTKPILFRAGSSNIAESSTTITVTKPAGVVDGDVMVASLESSNTSGPTAAPAGWTLLRSWGQSTVYWKVASSEPASYQWTYGATANTVGAITAYSGVDTVNPVDVSATHSGAFPLVMASMTTTQPAEMLIASWGGFRNASPTATWTPLLGMTERAQQTTTASSSTNLEVTEQLWPVAGATGTRTNDSTPGDNSEAGQWLALKPAGGSFLGSATTTLAGPSGATLKSVSISTPAVTFAAGDRLMVNVVAPNDQGNCGAALSYDGETTPSKLTIATIVPEGLAGLLLLAPALPLGARWRKRRRP